MKSQPATKKYLLPNFLLVWIRLWLAKVHQIFKLGVRMTVVARMKIPKARPHCQVAAVAAFVQHEIASVSVTLLRTIAIVALDLSYGGIDISYNIFSSRTTRVEPCPKRSVALCAKLKVVAFHSKANRVTIELITLESKCKKTYRKPKQGTIPQNRRLHLGPTPPLLVGVQPFLQQWF